MKRRLETPEDTLAFGRELAAGLAPGDVVALTGDLGAGKTQLVKGLAEGLGFRGEVSSPTFALLQEYRGGRCPLFHADWYRLGSAQELAALGIEEWIEGEGVAAIEWADRFPDVLPVHTRWFGFRFDPEGGRWIEERTGEGR